MRAQGESEAAARPLAEELAALASLLLAAGSVAAVVDRVAEAARLLVPGADAASVSLRAEDGTICTPARTEELAEELDELQNRLGEGPCEIASRPDGPGYVFSADVATDARWPRFGPAAARLGVGSVLAVTLPAGSGPERQAGALNVFSRAPESLAEGSADTMVLLAAHAALALARVEAVSRAELREEHLRKALASRDVIGQAKGILMERRGLSAQAAFEVLRRVSQQLNVRVAELAETLAARRGDL
jgi:GAF domain-containing protein